MIYDGLPASERTFWVDGKESIGMSRFLSDQTGDRRLSPDRRSRVRSGLVVNWGRSMIETRRRVGPTEHVWRARRAGLLAGVVVSGCASRDTECGAAWDDAHLPPQAVAAQSLLTPTSLPRLLAGRLHGRRAARTQGGVAAGCRRRRAGRNGGTVARRALAQCQQPTRTSAFTDCRVSIAR